MNNNRVLQRYDDRTRMNHWVLVLLFVGAGLSGLAFFHPSMYFLSNLFGGGVWSRILHPYMGVLMCLSFLGIFLRLHRDNRLTDNDKAWLRQSREMVKGNKANLPPVGKYNGAQKVIFWIMVASLAILFVTGFMFWHAWLPDLPVTLRRIAVLLHSASAVVLILSVIVHVYAAIWVKGTIRAMTRGTVTESWARTNHPLWHREMTDM